MQTRKEIRDQASEAIDMIETYTHPTIWRTSMRIYEIIMLKNPNWQQNIFLLHRQNFLHLLFRFCFSDSINAQTQISWERYEESQFEPITFEDINLIWGKLEIPENVKWSIYKYIPVNVRLILMERKIFELLKKWYDFEDANSIANSIDPEERKDIVNKFTLNGMSQWNIFYKLVEWSNKNKEKDDLPAMSIE